MQNIPVNHEILKWARETAGYSIIEVVKKLKKKKVNEDSVLAWERGESSPSYAQLKYLAYTLYKRPIALFFFPEIPDEDPLEKSFRSLPVTEIARISPNVRYMVRKAKVLRMNLAELNDGVNPAKKLIFKDIKFSTSDSVPRMVQRVKEYMGIDPLIHTEWNDCDIAFKEWRQIFERHGIYIFKDAFKDDEYSGLCLNDDVFPIILINNSQQDSRQIFTMFHELTHLLLNTGGIDARTKNYINNMRGENRKIETLCNKFAGEFLVPTKDFGIRIKGEVINDNLFKKLANHYNVSREVILRKLLDRELIDNEFYNSMVDKWYQKPKRRTSGGGNPYYTRRSYLGMSYIDMAFSKYHQRKISEVQLANYLGIKVIHLDTMEYYAFSK